MNATNDDFGRYTHESPDEGELWILYAPGEHTDMADVFAVVETLGISYEHADDVALRLPNDEGPLYHGRYLWTRSRNHWEGELADKLDESGLVLRLPEHPDDFDSKYRQALDYVTGYLTPLEILDVLNGEDIQSGSRIGFEGLRFWILEGVHESITEFSVGHGHGPSRYARAVDNRIAELPDWAADAALESEKERWSGGMEFTKDTAAKKVEILELREARFEEDHSEEIIELVELANLDYDVDHRRDDR